MEKYNHKDVEKKWQKVWSQEKLYETPDKVRGKDNYYTLVEFAYPSGNLHVGHWYAFSVPDMYARFMRMCGHNVLFPFGFDAFGLPAENAAIKRKLNPRKWTYDNIDYMREQLSTMGNMFDWSRKVVTSDPDYYKWTQWIFTQFFNKGLAYQDEVSVNWCPSCKTVLANEQVLGGLCERCDSEVEKRKMKQWMLRITDYADQLIDDLEKLDWPEPIKESQRQWIGRSNGANFKFQISNVKKEIEVFTTRPDTLFGATYLVLSPEHKEIQNLKSKIQNWDEADKYISTSGKKSELERQENKEKTGVELKGISAKHPITGDELPVWVADYVLSGVGTGAVMAVPAHDQRDYEFAQKFNLPIIPVIARQLTESLPNAKRRDVVKGLVIKDGKILLVKESVSSENTDGCAKTSGYAYSLPGGGYEDGENDEDVIVREMAEEAGYEGVSVKEHLGKIEGYYYSERSKVNRVRGVSCYLSDISAAEEKTPTESDILDVAWFTPDEAIERLNEGINAFESIFIERAFGSTGCLYIGSGTVANSGEFDGMDSEEAKEKITKAANGKKQTTYRLRDWLVSRQRYWGCPIPIVHCDKCGAVSVPDKELPVKLPEIEDYLPSGDGKSPLAKVDSFMNVACPKCGGDAKRETDTLDTFIDSSWYFLRYLDPHNDKSFSEKKKQKKWMPINFYSGGAEHTTMHLLYSRFFQKALHDLKLVTENEPYERRMNRGIILGTDGAKMSKSKGNVIDPDDVVQEMGADTVRMYLAFIGPYNEVGHYPWSTEGIKGVSRFIDRTWRLGQSDFVDESHETEVAIHTAIQKVTDGIETIKMNTAVAALMSFMNIAEKSGITKKQYEVFVRVLAPLAPHISEELWREVLDNTTSVHLEEWPLFDEALLEREEVTIAVQINGKTRGELTIASDTSQDDIEREAQALTSVSKWIEDKTVGRIVYVKGRLVNIVLD